MKITIPKLDISNDLKIYRDLKKKDKDRSSKLDILIPCAGNATRMGKINKPKALHKIGKQSSLKLLLKFLLPISAHFYIAINNKADEEKIYIKEISEEGLLDKITFVKSIPGTGDGMAVLDTLNHIQPAESDSKAMVIWGDMVIKNPDFIFFCNYLSQSYFDKKSFFIPLCIKENPYVFFERDKDKNIVTTRFNVRDEFINKGFTDFGFFFINPFFIRQLLENNLKTKPLKGIVKTLKGELNFLDLIAHLYQIEKPAGYAVFNDNSSTMSFNTEAEAEQIFHRLS